MPLARQWAMNAGVSDGTNPKGIATRAHFAPSCLPLWGRWHGEAVTERV